MLGDPRFLRRLGAVPDATADGLFWLIYTDVKRYGRTTRRRRVRRVPARLPQLPGHQPDHRRRVVGSAFT